MRKSPYPALFLAACAAAAAQSPSQGRYDAAAARMLEHIKVLSSDEFEGRAPGTRGRGQVGRLSAAGVLRELRPLPGQSRRDLHPEVPHGRHPLDDERGLPRSGGKTLTPAVLNDYVAVSRHVAPQVEVKDSDIVFVGYGVVAPEYGWDDFKGVDVRGKTVIMLVNDPPVPDPKDPSKLDDAMFKGKAMTYYGRWTYKYEEASAKGAAACLIVHETGPAGYPFAVVQGSWGRENFSLETPGRERGPRRRGGMDPARLREEPSSPRRARTIAALKAAAVRPDFHPVDFGAKASFTVENRTRPLASRNVIARLEGSDPALRDQYHHLHGALGPPGAQPPPQGGPDLQRRRSTTPPGARGCSRSRGRSPSFPRPRRPKRTVLFLVVTGEEQGLLGSEYYAAHPLYPLTKTLADINIDGMQTAGPSRTSR